MQVSVLRIACFPNFMELSMLLTAKRELGVFLCKFTLFELVFSDLPAFSVLNLLALFFAFFNFLVQ